jgi:hypothetical protein
MEILQKEAKLPKRERRSTQRLFEELRGHGYDGAHDSVHRFVKAWRDERVRVPVHAYVGRCTTASGQLAGIAPIGIALTAPATATVFAASWYAYTRKLNAAANDPVEALETESRVPPGKRGNGVGASIAVVGAVIGLVLTVTADEILLTLGLFGLGLWLVAIGFVIFGRPRRAR